MRWNVEQRLAFIEERLFWIGTVNRSDLVERFGVSISQASGDIARYLALDPPGVDYDKSLKRYVAGEAFKPVIGPPDTGRLLVELRLLGLGLLGPEQVTLGDALPVASTPLPERLVDPYVLRAVVRAIRERQALSVSYQSMSQPDPAQRVIEPHALAHDGYRWHARAFDDQSAEFRDFVIGRMTSPRLDRTAQSDPADDDDWNSWAVLEIAPHSRLTPAQAKAIAIDYGIHGRSASIRVRRSLLFYALKRLGLDVDPDARPPHEQQIVLVNRSEITALMGEESN